MIPFTKLSTSQGLFGSVLAEMAIAISEQLQGQGDKGKGGQGDNGTTGQADYFSFLLPSYFFLLPPAPCLLPS